MSFNDTLSLQQQPISSRFRVDPLTRKAIDIDGNGTVSQLELRQALQKDQVLIRNRQILAKPHYQQTETLQKFVQENGLQGQAFLSLFGADGVAVVAQSAQAGRDALKIALSMNIADARTLIQNYAEVERSIHRGAKVFPGQEEEQGLTAALDTSNDRILEGTAASRLTLAEAKQAQQMLDALADALADVHTGKATITLDETVPGDRQGWSVIRPNGDKTRLMVRPERTSQGEARIKMETVGQAGASLPKPQRMLVRMDHQKFDEKAALDVQFGDEFYGKEGTLDKKVHGLMLDANGEPKRSRDGKTIPDHHFEGGLPKRLDDPAQFKAFSQQFVEYNRLPR